jgi:hypothetical protein
LCFNQITPLLLSLYCPVPLLVNSLRCVSLYCLLQGCIVFQYHSLSTILFSSHASP